ncbi:MAG: ketosteroid isomerase-related protein [Pseudoxanthomonas sp.]
MKIDGTRRQDRATELVLAYYAAFNRGDRAAMLALLADDVAHDLNQGARETGREAFVAFMQRMDASYREQLREIVVMVSPDGTRAAAEYVVHGTYHHSDAGLPEATGQTYVLPGGAFFEVRGDRIARVSNYYNLQDWIAQVSAG